MKARATTVRTIDLGYEQLLVLDGGADTRVRVLFGGTWLTEEGVPGDSIAHAGEEIALRGGGHALLESLGPTRLQILQSTPRGLAQQTAQWVIQAVRGLRRLIERLHLGARPAEEPNA